MGNKTFYNALGLMILVWGIVLLIPFSSALTKSFNPIESSVSLEESGITKATIKLVDYNRYCFPGDCYMYLEVNSVDGGYVDLQDYKTYDALQVNTLSREKGYEYYNSTYSWNELENQYICDARDYQINQENKECYKEVEVIKTGRWLPLDYSQKFNAGTTNIRLKVDVQEKETVDVVPIFNGLELKEMALFTGMTRYEYLNTGQDNGAWVDTIAWAAQSFTIGTTGANVNFDIKGTSVMLQCTDGGVYTFYAHIYSAPPNLTSCYLNKSWAYGEASIDTTASAAWYNFTWTNNGTLQIGTKYCLYINSTSAGTNCLWNDDRSSAGYTGGNEINSDDGARATSDTMFEIWGELYQPPATFDLLAPTNNSQYMINPINFSCKIYNRNISNMTLYLNGVPNLTQSFSYYNTTFNYTTNLADGYYNWTCRAEDNNSVTYWNSLNYTFNVNYSLRYCNVDEFNVSYVNFTYKDEQTSANLQGLIDGMTLYYWTGNDASVNKTLTYSNTINHTSDAFCFKPQDKNISYAISNLQYSSTGYPQRRYSASGIFSNTTTNKILYLLSTADGIYVTFQVVNQAEQTISGAIVNATSSNGLIASGVTDDAGSITFFLNPDTSTTINAFKSGYPLYKTTIYPTSTSYTITLGGTAATNDTLPMKSINYELLPGSNYLINDTEYNFNFTFNSSYYDIEMFSINVSVNGTQKGFDSETGVNNGFVSVVYNPYKNSTVNVVALWRIAGENFSVSRTYYVTNLPDTGWSILNFGRDLRTYIGTGIFGLNEFGLNILVFLFIFITTGIISWKFGMYSPIAVTGVMFVLTLVCEGLGLITAIKTGVASGVAFIILLGAIASEVSSG